MTNLELESIIRMESEDLARIPASITIEALEEIEASMELEALNYQRMKLVRDIDLISEFPTMFS